MMLEINENEPQRQQEEEFELAYALQQAFLLHGSKHFLGSRSDQTDSSFTWITYEQMFHQSVLMAERLGTANSSSGSMISLSLPRRSVVGICADNCAEWISVDIACTFNDYISVGLHSSWTAQSLTYVLCNAGVQCLFCQHNFLPKFVDLLEVPSDGGIAYSVRQLVVLGGSRSELQVMAERLAARGIVLRYFDDLIAPKTADESVETTTLTFVQTELAISWFGLFQGHAKTNAVTVSGEMDSTTHTLLYTSGTTGTPKGVAVTKARWLADARSNRCGTPPPSFISSITTTLIINLCYKHTNIPSFTGQEDPTVVSYLSLAHGGDRGICWQAMFAGAKIGFARTCSHTHHDSNDTPSSSSSSSGGSSSSSSGSGSSNGGSSSGGSGSSSGGGSTTSAASATAGMDAVAMLLEDIQAIRPTFFLGMPHLWSECHVLYKKELESLVNDIVLTLLLTQENGSNEPLPSTFTRLLQGGDNSNDNRFSHLSSNPETSKTVLAAVRQLDRYDVFVDTIGTLYGVT